MINLSLDLLLEGIRTLEMHNYELVLEGNQHQLLVASHKLDLRLHRERSLLLKQSLLFSLGILTILEDTYYVGVINTIDHLAQLREFRGWQCEHLFLRLLVRLLGICLLEGV